MNYVGISEDASVYSDVVQIHNAKVNIRFGAVYNVVMSEMVIAIHNKIDNQFELNQRKAELRAEISQSFKDDEPYPEGIWGNLIISNNSNPIPGLGYPALNSLGTTPLFDQLVADSYSKNIFTMCLKDVGGTIPNKDILFYFLRYVNFRWNSSISHWTNSMGCSQSKLFLWS